MSRIIKVETPNTDNDFTTLVKVKTELQVTDPGEDAFLNELIDEVKNDMLRATGRIWVKDTVVEQAQAPLSTTLLLSRRPIISIASIVTGGSTMDDSDYEIQDAEAGFVYNENGWGGNNTESWRLMNMSAPRETTRGPVFNITVTYDGGYDMYTDTPTFPLGLQRIANMAVRHLFMNRRTDPTVQEHHNDQVSDSYLGIGYEQWLQMELKPFIEVMKP